MLVLFTSKLFERNAGERQTNFLVANNNNDKENATTIYNKNPRKKGKKAREEMAKINLF